MSCEGYYQCVCKNKHAYIVSLFDPRLYAEGLKIEQIPCDFCKARNIWNNFVDETNCDSRGYIRFDTYLDENDFPTVTTKFFEKYINKNNHY